MQRSKSFIPNMPKRASFVGAAIAIAAGYRVSGEEGERSGLCNAVTLRMAVSAVNVCASQIKMASWNCAATFWMPISATNICASPTKMTSREGFTSLQHCILAADHPD